MNLESNILHITMYGFKITMIRIDGESAVNTLSFDKLAALGIILDSTGAGEAVAVVERKIIVIKERVRAIINTVPFSLSELLESWLLRYYVVNRLNLVPTRNSVAYVSLREKLYGRKINVDKELKHSFGDYVQVHTDSVDNSNKPRSQAAIALVSAGNLE